ncbi:hypothetical protein H1R20_g1565, partial [Candolleomyces eurysporus]
MASTSTASTSSMTVVAPPTPALALSTSRTASASEQPQRTYDVVDEFFGYRFATSATQESRHDRTQSVVYTDAEALPPYAEEDSSLPAYTPYAEPVTLAMFLFKFGFLFPPFWIFGAFILLSPLREPPTTSDEGSPVWMPEKTEAERQEIIAQMRKVELKWAKRCLFALCIFLIIVALAIIAGWALFVRKH